MGFHMMCVIKDCHAAASVVASLDRGKLSDSLLLCDDHHRWVVLVRDLMQPETKVIPMRVEPLEEWETV